MVNPVLTIVFDLFVIGSAAVILAGLAGEYRAHRPPVVGARRNVFVARPRVPRAGAAPSRPAYRRRAA